MLLVLGIFGKLFMALKAQVNWVANLFWKADPIAIMQLQYDQAVDQLKDGRVGLEQYAGLVQSVTRQVEAQRKNESELTDKISYYLKAGDRESAGKYAVQLDKAKRELTEKECQLQIHQTAYENNVTKIQHATKKIGELKDKIQKDGADLKMAKAEAELAKVASSMNFDVTTDFGEAETMIQDKIDLYRGKAKVAADLSSQGIVDIKREEAMETSRGEDLLKQFEINQGLVTPETTSVPAVTKEMGPTTAAVSG